ncbi:MAG: MinD/ParA family ATP-binding protein [Candidatus Hodarchaeales archaeon]|jgi:MinD-like ATPase involved in chromosome partitioning or flagellar assembly
MALSSLKSLSVLSHKGGVGKTSISVNLAVHLAKEGHSVCLLENDFNGPSLNTWWNPEAAWLNDYLSGNASIDDCLQDISSSINLPGKLFVGFADPTPESIQKSIRFDEKASMMMLQNLIKAKRLIIEPPYEVEYLIIDCSPGIGYSAINAMLVAESSLFVVKLSNADIIGTSRMIKGLHKQLKKRTLVLANLIPKEVVANEEKKSRAQKLIENNFMQHVGKASIVNFLGWIPTDNTLISLEFEEALKGLSGEESSRIIYTLNQPNHIFSTTLVEQVPTLFKESD